MCLIIVKSYIETDVYDIVFSILSFLITLKTLKLYKKRIFLGKHKYIKLPFSFFRALLPHIVQTVL